MFEGILFIIAYIAIGLIISYLVPVIITKNIFNFSLTKKEYFSYFIYLLFFPISILFSKSYYKHLAKQNIVNTKMKFAKIIGIMFLISFSFSLFINQLLIKEYLVKPFQVNGQAMYSAIYDKQLILITNKDNNYNRGEIIVFKPGASNFMEHFIKRIVGLPGETIKIENGIVSKKVNGIFEPLEENYLNDESNSYTFVTGSDEEVIYNVPEDSYFVLGDNRNASTDSRTCFSTCSIEGSSHFISKKNIEGKYFFNLGYFDINTMEFKHSHLGIETKPTFFDIEQKAR